MDMKETLAGGIAGWAQAAVGHPFDSVKVQLQTNTKYTGMGHAFRSIAKEEGVAGLYKGVQSPLAGLFFMNAVIFSAYGGSRRLLGETPETPLSTRQLWAAGFMAGTSRWLCGGASDFFKCQLQVRGDQYKGFFNCASTIVKERGLKGAYQGIVPTLMRNGVANAAWYGGE